MYDLFCSKLSFKELMEAHRLKEDDVEQEAAERLKAQEPWRITDNELELSKPRSVSAARLSSAAMLEPFKQADVCVNVLHV